MDGHNGFGNPGVKRGLSINSLLPWQKFPPPFLMDFLRERLRRFLRAPPAAMAATGSSCDGSDR